MRNLRTKGKVTRTKGVKPSPKPVSGRGSTEKPALPKPNKPSVPSSPKPKTEDDLYYDKVQAAYKSASSKTDKLNVIKMLYRYWNSKTFDNKLVMPTIRFLRKQKVGSVRRLGHWHQSKRELAFTDRLFNGKDFQTKLEDTVVHEMCHQAVSEIDGIKFYRGDDPHGSAWQAWMRKAGFKPNAKSTLDRTELMHPEERTQQDKALSLMESHKTDKWPVYGTYVIILDGRLKPELGYVAGYTIKSEIGVIRESNLKVHGGYSLFTKGPTSGYMLANDEDLEKAGDDIVNQLATRGILLADALGLLEKPQGF